MYELTARNRSAINTAGPVTVSDQLPTGMTYLSGSGSGWTCAAVGQTITCTRASGLRAFNESELKLLVRVNAPIGAVLTNTATISPTDTNPSNNTTSRFTTVRR